MSKGVWPYQQPKPQPRKPSEELKSFKRQHSIFCDCNECNHEKPTPAEREQERRYLNGL